MFLEVLSSSIIFHMISAKNKTKKQTPTTSKIMMWYCNNAVVHVLQLFIEVQ